MLICTRAFVCAMVVSILSFSAQAKAEELGGIVTEPSESGFVNTAANAFQQADHSNKGPGPGGDEPADPIFGPDGYEPDNAPGLSSWSGVELLDLGIKAKGPSNDKRHNMHFKKDEDWMRFYASAGEAITLETKHVRPEADTVITLYRLAEEGEVLPSESPAECDEAWIKGPHGDTLITLACNDDFGPGIQSKIQFIAPLEGLYFARVSMSPKAREPKAAGPGSSGDTTYEFQAASAGLVSSALFCTVVDADTNLTIDTAALTVEPFSVQAPFAEAGIYVVNGLPAGKYTLIADCAGYASQTVPLDVKSGTNLRTLRLKREEAPKAPPVPIGAAHHANFDFAEPFGQIDLNEVLRVVQLFNSYHYHCDGASADSYGPYGGGVQCLPHDLDLENQDWQIDLSEVLRMVQFYSLGGYNYCADSPDGFCGGGL